jgi:hypothetical protein
MSQSTLYLRNFSHAKVLPSARVIILVFGIEGRINCTIAEEGKGSKAMTRLWSTRTPDDGSYRQLFCPRHNRSIAEDARSSTF